MLIDYPRKKLLTTSQATYSGRFFIFTTTNKKGTPEFDKILSLSNSYSIIVKGISSKVECAVENISIIYSLNLTYLKIQIDSENRSFQKGEGIEIISQETGTKIVENFVDNIGLEIENPGKNYAIGDKIIISNTNVIGTAKVKTLKEGSISDLEIGSGGTGYALGDQILTSQRSKGHSFSAVVSKIDRSNNYLSCPFHSSLDLTSGNFTIEAWLFMPASISDAIICSNKSSSINSGWTFKVDGSRKLVFQIFGVTTSTSISTRIIRNNAWVHVAASRTNNSIRLFVDGVKSSQDIISSGIASSSDLKIGSEFVGYIDELRITRGVSRYTDSFSLPSEAFNETDPDFASVSLMIHFSGNNLSSVFSDSSSYNHTLTTSGSIFISSTESKFGETSGFFSGLGSISKIDIYNHGYNYDSLPTLIVKTAVGTGAVLNPKSDNIGQIESIEIIDPFVDSYSTPVVTVISKNGIGAVLSPLIVPVFKERPSWKSSEGMLGLNCTLLDSHYYQQFSYYTYSPIPRKESDAIIDEWCHPSGFVRFAILDISFSDNFQMIGDNPQFYLTIVKSISDYDSIFLINPSEDPNVYNSETSLIYSVIKYRTSTGNDVLINPQSGLDWFKELNDNYSYTIGYWDMITVGDQNTEITDKEILSRKRINDNTLIMNKALDSEIEIRPL